MPSKTFPYSGHPPPPPKYAESDPHTQWVWAVGTFLFIFSGTAISSALALKYIFMRGAQQKQNHFNFSMSQKIFQFIP